MTPSYPLITPPQCKPNPLGGRPSPYQAHLAHCDPAPSSSRPISQNPDPPPLWGLLRLGDLCTNFPVTERGFPAPPLPHRIGVWGGHLLWGACAGPVTLHHSPAERAPPLQALQAWLVLTVLQPMTQVASAGADKDLSRDPRSPAAASHLITSVSIPQSRLGLGDHRPPSLTVDFPGRGGRRAGGHRAASEPDLGRDELSEAQRAGDSGPLLTLGQLPPKPTLGPQGHKPRWTHASVSSHRMQVWLVVPWGEGRSQGHCPPLLDPSQRPLPESAHTWARGSAHTVPPRNGHLRRRRQARANPHARGCSAESWVIRLRKVGAPAPMGELSKHWWELVLTQPCSSHLEGSHGCTERSSEATQQERAGLGFEAWCCPILAG